MWTEMRRTAGSARSVCMNGLRSSLEQYSTAAATRRSDSELRCNDQLTSTRFNKIRDVQHLDAQNPQQKDMYGMTSE